MKSVNGETLPIKERDAINKIKGRNETAKGGNEMKRQGKGKKNTK